MNALASAASSRATARAGFSPLSSRFMFAKRRLAALRAARAKRPLQTALAAGSVAALSSVSPQ